MRKITLPHSLTPLLHDRLIMVRTVTFAVLALAALHLLQFAYTTVYRGLIAPPPVDEQQVLSKQEKINRTLLEEVQRKDAAKRASGTDIPETPF